MSGVITVVLTLLPLRLQDRAWQMGAISTLLANGPWILVGLVLLHLACLLQPRNGGLNNRLGTGRRLAGLGAVLYLLITPLPPLLTWRTLAVNQNSRDELIRASTDQMRGYRRALLESSSLAELKQRLASIPGTDPLPAQLERFPFPVVRQSLLRQLEVAETRVNRRVRSLQADPNRWELWRKALQASLGSLMLALGFASGAEGWRFLRPPLSRGRKESRDADEDPAPEADGGGKLASLPEQAGGRKNARGVQLALQNRLGRWKRQLGKKFFGKGRRGRGSAPGRRSLLAVLGLDKLFGKGRHSSRRRNRGRRSR